MIFNTINSDITANASYVKKSIHGPNNPIEYPIGIAKAPYPRDTDIMQFAVFCLDSL